MSAARRFFSLSLLLKELLERAARRRTYVMRVAFALALYAAFWMENHRAFAHARSPLELLGIGGRLFGSLVEMLFMGIYLAVPALLCGVVTQEKERDSLVLLLLTNLKPWQIVLQKFAGGMVPVFSILLMALPLAGVSYTFGGFSTGELGLAVLVIALAALQVGAVATWCSCRCRTTGSAFVCTYLTTAFIAFAPVFLMYLADQMFSFEWLDLAAKRRLIGHFPPALWEVSRGPYLRSGLPSNFTAVGLCEIAGTTLFFLLLAVRALPRYAFAPPGYRLKRSFALLDRAMHALNRRFGSIAFGKKDRALPGGTPIHWRETRARVLARPEYLTRIFVGVLIPVVVIVLVIVNDGYHDRQQKGLTAFAATVAALGIVLLSTSAANSMVSERVNQTHELLLTTPMTAQQIVLEKASSLRALAWLIAAPLLLIVAAEAWAEIGRLNDSELLTSFEPLFRYLSCAALVLAIDLPLFAWLSIWCGLKCHSRMKAIGLALALITAWCALPLIVAVAFGFQGSDGAWPYIAILSPLTVPAFNEFNELGELGKGTPWFPVLVNAALYCSALVAMRWHCLRKADAYLRR